MAIISFKHPLRKASTIMSFHFTFLLGRGRGWLNLRVRHNSIVLTYILYLCLLKKSHVSQLHDGDLFIWLVLSLPLELSFMMNCFFLKKNVITHLSLGELLFPGSQKGGGGLKSYLFTKEGWEATFLYLKIKWLSNKTKLTSSQKTLN